VFNLRLSYNRFIEKGLGAANENFDLTKLGLSQSQIAQLPQPVYFGYWQINGYQNMGRYLGKNTTDDFSVNPNITKV
jgi:hypothetical protein